MDDVLDRLIDEFKGVSASIQVEQVMALTGLNSSISCKTQKRLMRD